MAAALAKAARLPPPALVVLERSELGASRGALFRELFEEAGHGGVALQLPSVQETAAAVGWRDATRLLVVDSLNSEEASRRRWTSRCLEALAASRGH